MCAPAPFRWDFFRIAATNTYSLRCLMFPGASTTQVISPVSVVRVFFSGGGDDIFPTGWRDLAPTYRRLAGFSPQPGTSISHRRDAAPAEPSCKLPTGSVVHVSVSVCKLRGEDKEEEGRHSPGVDRRNHGKLPIRAAGR